MNSKPERIILLADMDCFFVEVERLHRPELRGQAVIIGGQPHKRGVVSACSYEARRFGVHSAMPMGEAYRRLGLDPASPLAEGQSIQRKGVTVNFLHSGLHGNYGLYSRRVQDVVSAMVPVFRPKSVDEFEMDISGCETIFTRDYGGIVEFAEEMRRRVRAEVGLPMSTGIGPGRLIAKMASRHAKPDGVFRVLPEETVRFLAPHDVQDVPGIGPATAGTLRDMGINRVGQLLQQDQALLRQTFGIGMWSLVNTLRHGEDKAVPPPNTGGGHSEHGSMGLLMREDGHESPAIGFGPGRSRPKSIGHSVTLERDTLDPALIRRTLWRLTEDACRRLREKDLAAAHVTVTIRYSDFETVTHGTMLREATDLDRLVFETALRLFDEGRTRRLRIRLLGVRLEKLRPGLSQLRLFEPVAVTKERQLTHTLDALREKHGRDVVLSGPGVNQIGSERISTDSQAGVSVSISPQRSAV